MKADGKNAVAITLREGNADFAFLLSDYHVAIMPADGDGVDWKSGVGTGAYKLESFEPGVRTTFKRNPNYYKSGAGHFDECEIITIADVAARTNALSTGEIDAMDRVDLKTAHLLKRRPGVKIVETSGTQHFTFTMRVDTPPFDNVDVRLALKYAIDREAVLKTILRGHAYSVTTIRSANPTAITPANSRSGPMIPTRRSTISRRPAWKACRST